MTDYTIIALFDLIFQRISENANWSDQNLRSKVEQVWSCEWLMHPRFRRLLCQKKAQSSNSHVTFLAEKHSSQASHDIGSPWIRWVTFVKRFLEALEASSWSWTWTSRSGVAWKKRRSWEEPSWIIGWTDWFLVVDDRCAWTPEGIYLCNTLDFTPIFAGWTCNQPSLHPGFETIWIVLIDWMIQSIWHDIYLWSTSSTNKRRSAFADPGQFRRKRRRRRGAHVALSQGFDCRNQKKHRTQKSCLTTPDFLKLLFFECSMVQCYDIPICRFFISQFGSEAGPAPNLGWPQRLDRALQERSNVWKTHLRAVEYTTWFWLQQHNDLMKKTMLLMNVDDDDDDEEEDDCSENSSIAMLMLIKLWIQIIHTLESPLRLPRSQLWYELVIKKTTPEEWKHFSFLDWQTQQKKTSQHTFVKLEAYSLGASVFPFLLSLCLLPPSYMTAHIW